MDPTRAEGAPDDEEPAPVDGEEPAPPGDDSLPAHRVLTRALVTSVVAAPVMWAAVCAGWVVVEQLRGHVAFGFLVMSAVFSVLLGLCSGVARGVRRTLRPGVLLFAGVFSALVAGVGVTWTQGLVRGGPQVAWREVQSLLATIVEIGRIDMLLGFGSATLIVFMTLGLVQSRALPQILRRHADRLWLHLIAGLVGGGLGALAYVLLVRWEGEAAALWWGGALGCAAGLWLGERLDAAVQRWLKSRRQA